jgi:hypothetical protein
MKIHDQLFAKELIRHRCRTAMGELSEGADAALKEAFDNAMRPRILKLLAKRKQELAFPTAVAAIKQFKAANKKKIKTMREKKPTEGGN